MQQINPYLSKKPLAVGIKLIVKGFCRAYLSGLSLSWNISTVMVNHTSLELHLQVWDNVGKVVQYTFSIFHTRRSIMNTKLATAQIRVKNWAAIIQERNESGLSVKDYCAQHQLS